MAGASITSSPFLNGGNGTVLRARKERTRRMESIQEVIEKLMEKQKQIVSSEKKSDGTQNESSDGLEKEISLHKLRITLIEKEQSACNGCNGLGECRQLNKGIIPGYEFDHGGFFYETMTICPYAKAWNESSKISRLLENAHVPKRYSSIGFKDYHMTVGNRQAVVLAKAIIKSQDIGAYFYGDAGTGKTMLASIIANAKAHKGMPVIFTSVPELLASIRSSFKNGNTDAVTKAYRETPCLILDDLGAERMTAWVAGELFALINHRYNEKLQTIITANYSPQDMARHLSTYDSYGGQADDTVGKRIVSRIAGMCTAVHVDGHDQRMM